jgi:hypothetical protein
VSGPRIYAPVMYNGESDMFDLRMEAFEQAESVTHVVVEAPFTHRGVPKPMVFDAFSIGTGTRHDVWHVIDDWEPDIHAWTNEHHQRRAAWPVIDKEADGGDVVIIADVDEIPSKALLDFLPLWASAGGRYPLSVRMKTCLFAVDWVVPDPLPSGRPLPPTCVVATVKYLRDCATYGEYLGEVRDGRDKYPEFSGFGGWHFSWCGGPERQKAKLEESTCHVEILQTPEAELIRCGARWRSPENGGGLPVIGVEIDSSWPAYVYERRAPANWYRPRGAT